MESAAYTLIITLLAWAVVPITWVIFCYWFFLHTPKRLQATIKLRGIDKEKVLKKLDLYLKYRPARVRGTLPSMLQNRWFKPVRVSRKKNKVSAELRNLGHFIGIWVQVDENKDLLTLYWTGDFNHSPSKAVVSFLADQIESAVLTEWVIGPSTFFPGKTRLDTLDAVSQFAQGASSSLWTLDSQKRGQQAVELKIHTRAQSGKILFKLDTSENSRFGTELFINWMPIDIEAYEARPIVDEFIMQLIKTVSHAQRSMCNEPYSEDALRNKFWPSPHEFNEAIQTPEQNLSDEELQSGILHCNQMGLPEVRTGAFASVYRISSESESWAVRCFLTPLRDQEFRYYQLSNFIESGNLPYTVGFNYQAQGLRIQGDWFPILKMDWVEGETLDNYVRRNIDNPAALTALSERFDRMMLELQNAGVAHGDLQHGNIIVRNGELVLVDYDCMYIPALAGLESNELGHRNYQHPSRSSSHFGPYLDTFSAQVIGTSLKCIALDSTLWDRLDAGDDCLLFRRSDFEDVEHSKAFQTLLNHEDGEIKTRTEFLRELLRQSPDYMPLEPVSISLKTNAEQLR